MRVYHYLLLLLFFTLPFIHGKILPTLWIPLYIDIAWNFEFTKATFFNISASCIFITYFIENKKNTLKIRISESLFLCIILISSIFSLSPFISLIGDIEKWHTALLFLQLTWIYLILKSENRIFLEKCIQVSLISLVWICILWLKEYFFPTYDYGALSNRVLWSFGHPNYLAWYLILMLPFVWNITNLILKYALFLLICITLILCKSLIALFLASIYLIYYFAPNYKKIIRICSLYGLCILIALITIYFPEKLHSFISRFYLWETTLAVIFSDPKIFFVWWGLETLPYFFESFKSPKLYIYENYWYTADRPHNFLLNIWYHLWVWGVWIFIFLVYRFIKFFKVYPASICILLFLLYWIFHYFSIASYLILILAITIYSHNMASFYKESSSQRYTIYILYILFLISIIWWIQAAKLYQAELYFQNQDYTKSTHIFPHPRYFRALWDHEKTIWYESILSQETLRRKQDCTSLVEKYPSVENYFYCGEVFENMWKIKLSKIYYKNGLSHLPDLWNPDSLYWDNYFIKNTITWNRFFSEKFGDIKSILEKSWIPVEYRRY